MHHATPERKKARRTTDSKVSPQRRVIAHIASLIAPGLAQQGDNLQGLCQFLPSVMSLSRTLNCPAVEIHLAMKKLSEQGYRFLTLSLDSPVTVCSPSAYA